jgi:hypothetical protein
MANLLLGPLLRHVDDVSATLWVETDAACTVEILGREARTFRVFDHHYALVVVEGLEPGSTIEYQVELDGVRVWPLDDDLPPSRIRTTSPDGPQRLIFGSCRTAAPHDRPYIDEKSEHPDGRGVDAFRAHGMRMIDQPDHEWPDLAVFLGDQVYADDPSPGALARMRQRRRRGTTEAPGDVVADFEEYTMLYRESWTPRVERWMMSVVPTAMIFDDHDVIDDWNISDRWVRDIRATPWWEAHIIGALVSYWIYQHLGNQSPERIRSEGLLDLLVAAEDGTEVLTAWARRSEQFTPVPGGYQFSFVRRLGPDRLIVIDSRNGRELEPGRRRMVGEEEWAWVCEQALSTQRHLILATSLPIFVPGGAHGLQTWSEQACDGRWGSIVASAAERLRRALDLEDWPAFHRSFDAVVGLLLELTGRPDPPASITILAGDIHTSFVSRIELPGERGDRVVHQIVSSPIRNALGRAERLALRAALSRTGRKVGNWLERRLGRHRDDIRWDIVDGPYFHNGMGELAWAGRRMNVRLERAMPEDGDERLDVLVERQLAP